MAIGEPIRAANLLKQVIPTFNMDIAHGIAHAQFESAESYLLRIMREVAQTFPPGLEFVRMYRATPTEELKYILTFKAASKSSPMKVEIAESSVYLVFFEFKFNGELLPPQGIYLPFTEKGGQLWLRGVKNTIIPILTAPVFSVDGLNQQVFMKMSSAKIAFNRIHHTVMGVGNKGKRPFTLPVMYARIHQTNPKNMARYQDKKDETVKMQHASALYLFCSFGLVGAFKRYCGFEPTVYMKGIPDDIDVSYQTVFHSTGKKPSSFKTTPYIPHEICIGIPNEYLDDQMAMGLIAGFFYVTDSYTRVFSCQQSPDDLEDIILWRYILGKAVFLVNDQIATLVKEINRHMDYMATMLDYHQITDMKSNDIHIDNMIDLIAYLIRNYSRIIIEEDNGSLFDKRLLVLRNVFEEIIKGINTIGYKVNSGRDLNLAVVKRTISSKLSTEKILRLTGKPNICQAIMSPGDNMVTTHTNKVSLQNNISDSQGSRKISTHSPDHLLHASIPFVGNIMAIKHGEPTGRALLNASGKTTKSGITVIDPNMVPMYNMIAEMVRRD